MIYQLLQLLFTETPAGTPQATSSDAPSDIVKSAFEQAAAKRAAEREGKPAQQPNIGNGQPDEAISTLELEKTYQIGDLKLTGEQIRQLNSEAQLGKAIQSERDKLRDSVVPDLQRQLAELQGKTQALEQQYQQQLQQLQQQTNPPKSRVEQVLSQLMPSSRNGGDESSPSWFDEEGNQQGIPLTPQTLQAILDAQKQDTIEELQQRFGNPEEFARKQEVEQTVQQVTQETRLAQERQQARNAAISKNVEALSDYYRMPKAQVDQLMVEMENLGPEWHAAMTETDPAKAAEAYAAFQQRVIDIGKKAAEAELARQKAIAAEEREAELLSSQNARMEPPSTIEFPDGFDPNNWDDVTRLAKQQVAAFYGKG